VATCAYNLEATVLRYGFFYGPAPRSAREGSSSIRSADPLCRFSAAAPVSDRSSTSAMPPWLPGWRPGTENQAFTISLTTIPPQYRNDCPPWRGDRGEASPPCSGMARPAGNRFTGHGADDRKPRRLERQGQTGVGVAHAISQLARRVPLRSRRRL
jgi:hypothetical protein